MGLLIAIRVAEGPDTNSYKMTKNIRDVDAREEKTRGNMIAALKYVRNCHMEGRECLLYISLGKEAGAQDIHLK